MLVLGLDPSLTGFGWCVHDADARGKSRVVAKGRFKTNASQLFVTRYVYLREAVNKVLQSHNVDCVGVESPISGETWSEGAYGLFLYVNEAVYLHRKDVVFFDPLTLKFLTKEDASFRKGKMFKADMINLAKADTGIGRWSNDEADAYHIGRFAARFFKLLRGEITPEVLLPTEEQKFLAPGIGTIHGENKRYFLYSKETNGFK